MLNLRETHQFLRESDFENLFIQELGWEYHTQSLNITIDETEYTLTAIAQKRGMVVFECPATEVSNGRIPDYATRRKIQKHVAKSAHEHFIIYTDADKTTQIWQWVKREQGKPDACREHRYNRNEHSGEALIQKLHAIAFSFQEEEQLTLLDVTGRVGTAFYAERVTKKFYDHFKREHTAFLKFLKGVPDEEMQKWYASVMLNRLMFIYFIQKKSFLDTNPNYLHTKLTESQAKGTNRYYKDFLCPLFFEGFAKPEVERSREVQRLLGKVPYLNGGIFQNTRLRHSTAKTLRFPTKHLNRFSTSLNNTNGTLMTVHSKTITRLTPMCLATSLKSTSTRSRWVPTTPKRTSRSTSAKTPSFRFSLTRRKKRVELPLKARLPCGNSSKPTQTAISTLL